MVKRKKKRKRSKKTTKSKKVITGITESVSEDSKLLTLKDRDKTLMPMTTIMMMRWRKMNRASTI